MSVRTCTLPLTWVWLRPRAKPIRSLLFVSSIVVPLNDQICLQIYTPCCQYFESHVGQCVCVRGDLLLYYTLGPIVSCLTSQLVTLGLIAINVCSHSNSLFLSIMFPSMCPFIRNSHKFRCQCYRMLIRLLFLVFFFFRQFDRFACRLVSFVH